MDSSPPFDWTRIATKDDIQSPDPWLHVINKRFDLIDMRFDLLEARLEAKMLRITIGSTLTSIGVLASLMALLR